jgi:hypothetical protein
VFSELPRTTQKIQVGVTMKIEVSDDHAESRSSRITTSMKQLLVHAATGIVPRLDDVRRTGRLHAFAVAINMAQWAHADDR